VIHIPEHEIQFEFVRSSGPGGQNVNKVNSKVRLRWNILASPGVPDEIKNRFLELFGNRLTALGEIIITSDKTRDQKQNREDCLEKLRRMIFEAANPPKPRKKTKPSRSSKEKRRKEKKHHSKKKNSRSSRNWD
jgi:ribosome-associated protein